MKNVSLLPSEGKVRVLIMSKFCLHFDGNEFFFFYLKCGCYRACVIVSTDEVLKDGTITGVWSNIGNVAFCSGCRDGLSDVSAPP